MGRLELPRPYRRWNLNAFSRHQFALNPLSSSLLFPKLEARRICSESGSDRADKLRTRDYFVPYPFSSKNKADRQSLAGLGTVHGLTACLEAACPITIIQPQVLRGLLFETLWRPCRSIRAPRVRLRL